MSEEENRAKKKAVDRRQKEDNRGPKRGIVEGQSRCTRDTVKFPNWRIC